MDNKKKNTLILVLFQERDELYTLLVSTHLQGAVVSDDLVAARQAWLAGARTNFDYLTQLNSSAGRSFNDLMQYPIFPFILAAYNTDDLDLDDPNSYRSRAPQFADVLSAVFSYRKQFRNTHSIQWLRVSTTVLGLWNV